MECARVRMLRRLVRVRTHGGPRSTETVSHGCERAELESRELDGHWVVTRISGYAFEILPGAISTCCSQRLYICVYIAIAVDATTQCRCDGDGSWHSPAECSPQARHSSPHALQALYQAGFDEDKVCFVSGRDVRRLEIQTSRTLYAARLSRRVVCA